MNKLEKTEDELIGHAARVQQKYAESMGFTFEQPCRYSSGLNGDVLTLRNLRGVIAKFKVSDKKLTRLAESRFRWS